MREIAVEQYIQMDNAVPVDVRSPIEFEECSIPGAVNVPLFTNEERVEIGTLYKKKVLMRLSGERWKSFHLKFRP